MGTHIFMPANNSVSQLSENRAILHHTGDDIGSEHCILWLQDRFYSDRLGRKVAVMAPSRVVASRSLLGFLYELTGHSMSLDELLWVYRDPHDKKTMHGPYSCEKMVRWYSRNYFDGQMPVLYARGGYDIWIPVWMVEHFVGFVREGMDFVDILDDSTQPGDAMEWESTIQQDICTLRQGSSYSLAEVVDRRDKRASHCVAPMDYDLIVPIADAFVDECGNSLTNVHIVAVLDTNVLLSHFSFLERVFGEIQEGGVHVKVSLLVVIPWIVLNELDHLKEGRQRQAALYAIKRIHTLHSQRDSYMFIQGAGSHQHAVDTISLPDQQQSLRNDDFIMQTCIYFRDLLVKRLRQKGHRAHAVLVSNDRGLQVRATANGVACIKAADFGRNGDALVKKLDSGDVSVIQEGHNAFENASSQKEQGDLTKEVENFLHTLHIQAESSPPKKSIQATDSVLSHASHDHGHEFTTADSEEVKRALEYAIQHGLGSFVMYCRQQDLGDLWEDLLEDELKPPWEAIQVLKVITRHSTTFWSVFDRSLLADVKTLLRDMHQSRFALHLTTCITIVSKLLHAAEAAFLKPINEMNEPPDPSTVPNFISLGDTKLAITEAKMSLDAIIAC